MIKRIFWAAAVLAGAAEGVVIYTQWPQPPVKVCASRELGELLAIAARTEAELRDARLKLRNGDPDDGGTKEVMAREQASASAMIAVAKYKQRALEEQKASGKKAGADGTCS